MPACASSTAANHKDRPIKQLRKYKPVAARLALKEYIPFAAWLLAWFLIGLAVGHADAVRMLAALAFVQGIRAVGTLETGQVLALHVDSDPELLRRSRRRAWRIDLLGLLASLLLLAALVAFLHFRGMDKAAVIVAIVGAGIPARNPGLLLLAAKDRTVAWRIGASVTIVTGAALVFFLDLGWIGAAAVLAARDWGGLISALLFAPRRPARETPPVEQLRFRHVAGRTESSARRRLSYRLIKSLASVFLGPFGNFAARTGREVGKIDSRLARFVPRNKPSMMLFTLGTTGAAIFFLAVSREPSTLLAGAAFARLAGTGGASLIWWNYAADQPDEDDDDD